MLWIYWVKENVLLNLIPPFSFYLSNVATRKFRIRDVVGIILLLGVQL